MDYSEESLKKHREWHGKIEVVSRVPVETKDDLSLAYTPGVAEPCLEINRNPAEAYNLTRRSNMVAVITDGTAVLGLGDIGPEAAMPVMEGKCVLFKALADVDAFPLCVNTHNINEIVETIRLISNSFGGINIEDISAPRCFEIERRLKECVSVPVFHDDQHGTAIVVLAAVINALRLTGKKASCISAVVNGAGAAGVAVSRLLVNYGLTNVTLCDRQGAIYKTRDGLTPEKQLISEITNPLDLHGGLADVMKGADIFIGVSAPGCVTCEMVESMNKNPIVLPLSNPIPEITPELAKAGGAFIIGTGRSDYPNQINNALAFPGVFRGALDARAAQITEEMKRAAAEAIAGCVTGEQLSPDYIIPSPLDREVAAAVAKAVANAAVKN